MRSPNGAIGLSIRLRGLAFGLDIEQTPVWAQQGEKTCRTSSLKLRPVPHDRTNRAWCIAHGDLSQPAWDDAPEWQRSSAMTGVQGVIDGNGPRESHACWLAEKEATGWKFGPVKDPEAKEHPCFVPYDELLLRLSRRQRTGSLLSPSFAPCLSLAAC